MGIYSNDKSNKEKWNREILPTRNINYKRDCRMEWRKVFFSFSILSWSDRVEFERDFFGVPVQRFFTNSRAIQIEKQKIYSSVFDKKYIFFFEQEKFSFLNNLVSSWSSSILFEYTRNIQRSRDFVLIDRLFGLFWGICWRLGLGREEKVLWFYDLTILGNFLSLFLLSNSKFSRILSYLCTKILSFLSVI